jgi:hypothetical protein
MKGAVIMKLTYRTECDCMISNLLIPQQPEVPLGKYAELRRQYLMRHRRVLYTNLKTTAKLAEHLAEIEIMAKLMVNQITLKMAHNEGVTESLKLSYPIKWTGLMNSYLNSAELS